MTQLIITVITIALTALLVLASVNYVPWWHKTASDVEDTVRSSLHLVEQAYDVATRDNNGQAPAVDATAADGGFVGNFVPVLRFLPATVPQFHWKYGIDNGMNYVCMESDGSVVNEGLIKGLFRAKSTFSEDQVFLNTTCGARNNVSSFSADGSAVALTMFVAYVPGISR